MISFDLPRTLLAAPDCESEPVAAAYADERGDCTDDEGQSAPGEAVGSAASDGDTVHVELGDSKTAAPNLRGTASEVAARYTAKELKDMLKERGVSGTGDKRSLAKQLQDAAA